MKIYAILFFIVLTFAYCLGQQPQKTMDNDYGFLGFVYSSCRDQATMNSEFKMMKDKGARHVRMYGACDDVNFLAMILNAAGPLDLGVIATIWFGYNGDDSWKERETLVIDTIKTHPYAYLVVAVSFGNEELFDGDITPERMIAEFKTIRSRLAPLKIPVTTAEQTSKYEPDVAKAVDIILDNAHPYFADDATTGANAWPFISSALSYFNTTVPGKKVVVTETGWPSTMSTSPYWQPSSPNCVTSLASETDYWNMMSSHCPDWKARNMGYFVFCFNADCTNLATGWGVFNNDESAKFDFVGLTAC